MSQELTRTCNICGITDNIKKFRPNHNLCKTCHNKKEREKYSEKLQDETITKICKTCNEEKNITLFQKQRANCKECVNKRKRVINTIFDENQKKLCIKCNDEKPISRFRPSSNVCKDCVNNRMRTYFKGYYEQNKVRLKEIEKIRNEKLAERLDMDSIKICNECSLEKKQREFRLNRKNCLDCERKYHKEFKMDKRHNDILFRIIDNCRTRLSYSVKKLKNNSTIEYLGVKDTFLITWLEFCLDEKMSFDNYGEYWHVDHVIPVSRFNIKTEDEIYICFNWKNLSPLSAKENLTKSNNILKNQILAHIEKLNEFNKINNSIFTDEIEEYQKIFNQYL